MCLIQKEQVCVVVCTDVVYTTPSYTEHINTHHRALILLHHICQDQMFYAYDYMYNKNFEF